MRKAVVVPRSLEVELQRESSLRDGSLDLVLKAQDLRTNSMTKVILNLQMGYVEKGSTINMHKNELSQAHYLPQGTSHPQETPPCCSTPAIV